MNLDSATQASVTYEYANQPVPPHLWGSLPPGVVHQTTQCDSVRDVGPKTPFAIAAHERSAGYARGAGEAGFYAWVPGTPSTHQ